MRIVMWEEGVIDEYIDAYIYEVRDRRRERKGV